ncbi:MULTISPECIES: hypothetical protein [Streptomyces]|uniref:Uncharacterized protein n=2 Tax=Streptomyces TaxID=1883 RepID=A0A3R7LLI6_9ACTN|nr:MULTISPECIES: hypothetical protein [Streptomyces]KNE82674.1 hypothetical protein ADZ36_09610 [Streptomyces fradiae]OFA52341.1 hypothetical protein BEN35_11780 [Streptomyces fradiae]PQM21009.1 hypothetical protein Sfr7A_23475 [Streptomyces xinghaiensis]RKM92863.1 hypothetical protein SFRA_023425 [Streptomyces xinghaiensis]RNC72451.1 hypothetical protein DC095_018915 [Streptomyces xinghaiensis]
MPTYHEVISTDLSALTKAAERRDGMAEESASLVKDLTGVISERAQQALNGEDPTGRLDE